MFPLGHVVISDEARRLATNRCAAASDNPTVEDAMDELRRLTGVEGRSEDDYKEAFVRAAGGASEAAEARDRVLVAAALAHREEIERHARWVQAASEIMGLVRAQQAKRPR